MNSLWRRGALAGVLIIAGFLLGGGPAAAAITPVRPPSPGFVPSNAYLNMKAAIQLLWDCGAKSESQELYIMLIVRQLAYDPAQTESGLTSNLPFPITSVDASSINYSAGRVKLIDPVKNYGGLLNLARTLYHERVHSKDQGGYPHDNRWTDANEREAWSKTLKAMMQWVANGLRDYENFKGDAAALRAENKRLLTLVSNLSSSLGVYVAKSYYAASPNKASWNALGTQLTALSTQLGNDELTLHQILTGDPCAKQCANADDARLRGEYLLVNAKVGAALLQQQASVNRLSVNRLNERINQLEAQRAQAEDDVSAARTTDERMAAADRMPDSRTLTDLEQQRDAAKQQRDAVEQAQRAARDELAKAQKAANAARAAYDNCRITWYQTALNQGAIEPTDLPADVRVIGGTVLVPGTVQLVPPGAVTGLTLPERNYEEARATLESLTNGIKIAALDVPDEETAFAAVFSPFTAPLTQTLNTQPGRVVEFESNAYDPYFVENFGLQNTHVFGIPSEVGGGTALTFSASGQRWAELQDTLCAKPGVSCGNDTCPEIQLPSLERPFEEPNASAVLQLAALGEGDDELAGRAREVEDLPRFEEPPAEPEPPAIQLAALVTDTATIKGQIQDTQGNALPDATLGLFPEGEVANLLDDNPANDPDYPSGGPILIPIGRDGTYRLEFRNQYDTDDPPGSGSLSVSTGQPQSGSRRDIMGEALRPSAPSKGATARDLSTPGQAQTGTPGLGQMPSLNWTFKVGARWASKSEPIVRVTPRIIRN